MEKVESYKIVTNICPTELKTDVNELIEKGWQPIGPVLISIRSVQVYQYQNHSLYNNEFHQTMFKYKE